MIYTHVVKKDLLSIEGSIDALVQALSDPDKNNNNLLLSGNL
ncbi:hypothetical protein ABN763_12910 [Spongiivirga sp. MCCC 1A20706]